MGVSGQRHATRYPLYRRLGEPQGRSGQVRKIPPPQGFDPRIVQPVASHYTDNAIPAQTHTHTHTYIYIYVCIYIYIYVCVCVCVCVYRVSQEKCARLRESVPYVKVYRYNPKHLYPKLNGYGDNGQRSLKLWQLLQIYWLPNTY